MKLLNTITFLLVACVSIATAADHRVTVNLGKAPRIPNTNTPVKRTITSDAVNAAAIASTPLNETLATETVIAPGSNAIFAAQSNFAGAEKMGFSVTTLSDANSKMTQVRFGIGWAAPGDWYVLTDMILGSNFYYWDHGGATVPVYGPELKIVVFNDGTTPVTITQLSVYAVAH